MNNLKGFRQKLILSISILTCVSISLATVQADWFNFSSNISKQDRNNVKLYWLTADGLRADDNLFKMYQWAEEGKLPNIKKLMDNGVYGYSTPEFPSLTSNNIASLHTGSTAKTHGIVEGAMRVEGRPLQEAAINGFHSASKNVDPTWAILEKAGKKSVVLSVPGSTPPEVTKGITIRGRWGNWGFDTPAVTFEPQDNYKMRKETIPDFYFATLDKKLTRFVKTKKDSSLKKSLKTFSAPIKAPLKAHGGTLVAHMIDSSNDKSTNYDVIKLSNSNGSEIANIKEGEWTEWFPITLENNGTPVKSQAKVRAIKLWPDGRFRLRVLYNTLNEYMTQPSNVAEELTANVGPMVDFLDNCLCLGMAPQLIVEPEDRLVALEEAEMSWKWHKSAAGYILKNWKPDALIQDFYTPNQMLVSRWWMGDIDPKRKGHNPEKAKKSWEEVMKMYQGVDKILGEAMQSANPNTLFVLSSEHGTASLYRNTRLNNLFAKKGWLKFKIDEETKKATIDWEKSKVVYLKMAHIYINPKGLAGNFKYSSGSDYETLRDEVIAELRKLKDKESGIKPIRKIVKRENAEKIYNLPINKVGDLIVEATTGYRLWEEMTNDKVVFTTPWATGYKEGIDPNDPAIRSPFIISGPGVKKGLKLTKTIRHIDQLPTILNLMNIKSPNYVEGQVVKELIELPIFTNKQKNSNKKISSLTR